MNWIKAILTLLLYLSPLMIGFITVAMVVKAKAVRPRWTQHNIKTMAKQIRL